MKLAILTQPLGHNYGGLLQAFALQQVLMELGHEVETLDRREQPSWHLQLRLGLKQLWALVTGRSRYATRDALYHDKNLQLLAFRAQYLKNSVPLETSQALQRYLERNDFAAIVVGSDQVWRPRYSPHLPDYFIGFPSQLPRISYAASFGVNDFDVPAERLPQYAQWLRQFTAVSVREASAVELCAKLLQRDDAQWVLDPTLLLEVDAYRKLLRPQAEQGEPQSPYIASYVLDPHTEVQSIAAQLAARAELPVQTLLPTGEQRLPSVSAWLQKIAESEYVITDSFHGCVFALLFQKKFIAIGNSERGLDRFTTLLTLFSQQHRLISVSNANDCDTIYQNLQQDIDWDAIELTRAHHKQQSLAFLQGALQQLEPAA